MMDENKQDSVQGSLEILKRLKRNYEKEEESTRFFISEGTTMLYRELISGMKNETENLYRQMQEWQ